MSWKLLKTTRFRQSRLHSLRRLNRLLRSVRADRVVGFVFTAVLAIALGSCSPSWFSTEAAQVPRIVDSFLSDPKTFNVVLNEEYPNVFDLTYVGMLSQNGVTGDLEPELAESWEVSDDRLRIVFTLRDGLRWSDGEPLTVEDVVFTFNSVYFNETIPNTLRDVMRIGESRAFPTVTPLGDRQVEFTVPEPFAPFLSAAGETPIVPKHALEPYVTAQDAEGNPEFLSTWGTDTDPVNIVTNGPYLIESYEPSQRVTFQRNPYYWRTDDQNRAMPYVERIVRQIVESTDNALLQFRSGGLDVVGVSPENFSLLKHEERRGDFTIYNGGPTISTSYLTFNLNKGRRRDTGEPLIDPIKSAWFNTVAFRQAVAYSIDRQTMINNIFRGLGEFQDSPISSQSPYYLSPDDGLTVYRYDTETAKDLLKKSGFQYNDDNQLLDAEGNRVRFTLLTNSGNRIREAMGAQIKYDLAHIGIQVDFQPMAFHTLVDKITTTMDWEAQVLGFTDDIEPHSGAATWLPDGQFHDFNLKSDDDSVVGREVMDWEAEIGRLYIAGSQELDKDKRKEIYADAQQLIQDYVPFIHLVNPLALGAIRNRIKEVQYSALGKLFWNVYQLRLE
ncbi:MAG: ABC transporter substrate-binding protein [Elainellaceae cyanobacterium]